ncbi:MAG: DUF167 domain-containing protein [Bacillota bacterium]
MSEPRVVQVTTVPGGVLVPVRVQPRSSRSRVEPPRDGAVVVRVTAPPVEGEANRACLETVAEWLGVRKSQVSLAAGPTSRHKKVLVAGLGAESVLRAIERL